MRYVPILGIAVLLAACSGMSVSGEGNTMGAKKDASRFSDPEPWTPWSAYPTQRAFNPDDPYHGR